MHSLMKAACAVHNLSLGAAFGAPLFAKVALRPAVIREIKDERERGRVMACAWTKYNRINVPAHLLFTATWLVERRAIMKIYADPHTLRLVAFKDILIAGALLTGLANVAVGNKIQRDYPEGVPVSDKPTNDAKLEAYRRYFRVMGPANLILVGASLAMGPIIAGSIIHAERKSLLRRLFSR